MFHTQEVSLHLGGQEVGGMAAWIELQQRESFNIGASLRDGNHSELASKDLRVTWASDPSLDWSSDGHVAIHSLGKVGPGVDWDARVNLDYADRQFLSTIRVDSSEQEQFAVEGRGHYGQGEAYW